MIIWDEYGKVTPEAWEALLRRTEVSIKGYVILRNLHGSLYLYDQDRQPTPHKNRAIEKAEKLAVTSPGQEIFVAKLVSVSRTPPATVTTKINYDDDDA